MWFQFNCCGVDGPLYWVKRNMNSSLSLPLSCCGDVGQNATCAAAKAWPDGCLRKSVVLVSETSRLLFFIIISIAAVKVIRNSSLRVNLKYKTIIFVFIRSSFTQNNMHNIALQITLDTWDFQFRSSYNNNILYLFNLTIWGLRCPFELVYLINSNYT